jgi:hypothetical protein
MQDVPTTSRNSSYDRRSDRRHTHHPLGKALAIIVCDDVFVYHRRVYVLTLEVVFSVSLTDSLFLCPLDLPRYVMGSFIVCRVSRPVAWKFWKVERTLSLRGSIHCIRPHYMPACSCLSSDTAKWLTFEALSLTSSAIELTLNWWTAV